VQNITEFEKKEEDEEEDSNCKTEKAVKTWSL
jgi:hypothetical protein